MDPYVGLLPNLAMRIYGYGYCDRLIRGLMTSRNFRSFFNTNFLPRQIIKYLGSRTAVTKSLGRNVIYEQTIVTYSEFQGFRS